MTKRPCFISGNLPGNFICPGHVHRHVSEIYGSNKVDHGKAQKDDNKYEIWHTLSLGDRGLQKGLGKFSYFASLLKIIKKYFTLQVCRAMVMT